MENKANLHAAAAVAQIALGMANGTFGARHFLKKAADLLYDAGQIVDKDERFSSANGPEPVATHPAGAAVPFDDLPQKIRSAIIHAIHLANQHHFSSTLGFAECVWKDFASIYHDLYRPTFDVNDDQLDELMRLCINAHDRGLLDTPEGQSQVHERVNAVIGRAA